MFTKRQTYITLFFWQAHMFRIEERFLYIFLILSHYIFDLARKKVKEKVLLVQATMLYSANSFEIYLFYLRDIAFEFVEAARERPLTALSGLLLFK